MVSVISVFVCLPHKFQTCDTALPSPLYLNVRWSWCRMAEPSISSFLVWFLPSGKERSVKAAALQRSPVTALLSHLPMSGVLESLWHLPLLNVSTGKLVQESPADVPYYRGNFLQYTDYVATKRPSVIRQSRQKINY